MKLSILLLAFTAAAFTSCTTAYKTGQTPDDVYYSPVRPQDEYVRVEKQDDRQYRGSEDYYEDRFLRMRMQDRYRWSALDDYYFYNTYAYNAYGNYYNWNSPWNSYWAWNNYYNPYCGGIPYYYPGTIIIKNPRTYTPPSRALVFNPSSYNTRNLNSPTGNRSLSNSYNGNRYSNSNRNNNSNNSLGESIRKVFTGNNNNNSGNYNSGSNNNSTPSRSYTPSSSSSSSSGSRSSGSSSSGGGTTRPPR
jgi:uncharacterized membrane protein YgcG